MMRGLRCRLAKGSGVKGNYLVQKLAEAFGIDSVSMKIMGPRTKNLSTRAKTIFKALALQRDPVAEAHAMGKMLFLKSKGALCERTALWLLVSCGARDSVASPRV